MSAFAKLSKYKKVSGCDCISEKYFLCQRMKNSKLLSYQRNKNYQNEIQYQKENNKSNYDSINELISRMNQKVSNKIFNKFSVKMRRQK